MKKYIIYLILCLVIAVSCKQDFVETPSFDVSVEKTTWNVGDTIKFDFIGNPDFITFYSGENGKRYENITRTTEKGTPSIQFTSLFANGTQANSLYLMISNDFQGIAINDQNATVSNISNANWTDITNRATLSTGKSTTSGVIDLSDFAANDKPVYIAFKYTALSGSIQPKWTISNLTVTNVLSDASTYTLANLTSSTITNYGNNNLYSSGWVAYKVLNNYNWVIGSTLVITGATTVAAATESSEAWTFIGPIDLNKVTSDLGTYLKGMDTRLENYTYIYSAAGNYTATFVASSNNVYGSKEICKPIQLIINP